ncbi:MAG: RNA polymerase sigma factor [Zavarzinella sp.]
MALLPYDRELLERCLQQQSGSWNDFVDRFAGLFHHIIRAVSFSKCIPLQQSEVDDVLQDIFLQIIANDFTVLRSFRGDSSLATYLTIIAQRCVTTQLARIYRERKANRTSEEQVVLPAEPAAQLTDEVNNLLSRLKDKEREVVRLFYLEGRSYEEISSLTGIPLNSVGPIISRAKKKLNRPPANKSSLQPKIA